MNSYDNMFNKQIIDLSAYNCLDTQWRKGGGEQVIHGLKRLKNAFFMSLNFKASMFAICEKKFRYGGGMIEMQC